MTKTLKSKTSNKPYNLGYHGLLPKIKVDFTSTPPQVLEYGYGDPTQKHKLRIEDMLSTVPDGTFAGVKVLNFYYNDNPDKWHNFKGEYVFYEVETEMYYVTLR